MPRVVARSVPLPALVALVSLAALAAVGGCAHAPDPDAQVETEARPVRVASTGLKYGDCAEARARAAANPALDVDRIPAPVAMKPAPFQKFPTTVLRKDGSATIKVDVVIDTLGHPDMRTFKPVEVSHPWFERNLRTTFPKWTFEPAMLAGCKVPRVYHFMASLPPRGGRRSG